ncbi:MAG: bifunctional phosphopantothenoylcysteine decarboxylase/phosphopantothenate--cysteine ligase CoaBC [Edaphobacter sp.]
MSAQHLKVTVAVCGGIAAYKSVELVRLLQDAGFDPHVVMTRAAEEFLRPLTFAAITGHKVITSLWSEDAGIGSEADESGIEHINEAQTTQALIVAPATAHALAKFAHGLADDFLSTMYLATTAPVIMAPAMNVNMWNHPATRANIETLRARGVTFVEPGSGYLACGMVGGGRLADNTAILAAVQATLSTTNDLTGETVLVTAGGTREAIDPVRFIGNRSSGRMGFAIAAAAERRGARVLLIAAPTTIAPPTGCEVICVTSAAEMQTAALQRLNEATIVVMAAAVSDYTIKAAPQKLKRDQSRTLELEPTTDILRELSTRRSPGTLVIGFAAETENALANGRAKLERKGVDAIVVNDVSSPHLGFDSENNAGSILTKDGEVTIPPTSKTAMAERILDEVQRLRTVNKVNQIP